MMSSNNSNAKKSQAKSSKELVDLYESMDDERKFTLSEFADFLFEKSGPVIREIPPPDDIPRPETETVVGAVKRLKTKYHMIDSMSVFSAASSLMTENMVSGRDVVEVIDDLETLFDEAYAKLIDSNERDSQ